MNIPSTFKPVTPEWVDKTIIKDTPYRLWRFDNLEKRFYFEFPPNSTAAIPYISVTSLADLVLAKSKFFERYLMDTGTEAISDMRKRAVFGTVSHINSMAPLKGDDPIHGYGYNFDWLLEVDEFGESNFQKLFPSEYRADCHKWYRSFVKGLLAWFVFVQERVEKVVAIEVPLRTRKGVAATLDFVGQVRFNGKIVNAIIDMKSNLSLEGEKESDSDSDGKRYYDSHQFQLEMQKDIWNENYGKKFKVTHVFNWSPKNWKDSPTWTFQNQTDNEFSKEVTFAGRKMKSLDFYLQIARIRKLYTPPSKVASIVGVIDNLKTFDWKDCIFEFNVAEGKRRGRKPKIEQDGIIDRPKRGRKPKGESG